MPQKPIRQDWEWEPLLKALAHYGQIDAACEAVDIPARTVYNRRQTQADFKLITDTALQRFKGRTRKELVDVALPVNEDGTPKARNYAQVRDIDRLANPEDYQQNIQVTHGGVVWFSRVQPPPLLTELEVDEDVPVLEAVVMDVEDE